ncbi:unnamed protein product [Scytosiphon promiscuus]
MTAPAATLGEAATAAAAAGGKRQDDSFSQAPPPNGGSAGRADAADVEQQPPAVAAVTASQALRHSFTVGLSGGGATVFSVATMMWLHTIITYQQRHGTKFGDTCKILWRQGGPRRFYRGVLPSFASAPLCRFGDTLSNELAMVWFNGHKQRGSGSGPGNGGRHSGGIASGDKVLPVWVATFLGSMGAAAFHALVPFANPGTQVIMQVDGKEGLAVMKERIRIRGPIAAYDGALAFAGGSLMGHYPWYLTYNILEQKLPRKGEGRSRRARSAFIGAAASIVSAAASNAFRVLKVFRQSHDHPNGLSYAQSVRHIIKKDGGGARGVLGIFGRGLGGRVAASALQQGLVFNMVWQEMAIWSSDP